MTWLEKLAPNAGPADVLFMAYVAFTGVIILAMGWTLTPGLWFGLVLLHVGMLAFARWAASKPLAGRSVKGFLRDLYPLFFITPLYFELRYLALFFAADYHDDTVLAMEEALFGEQLAMTFSERVPVMWISEVFHFFYAFYWVLIPLAGGLMYLRARQTGFRELVWAQLVTFFTCYFFFIFWPVQGPHYEFPPIGQPWSEGFWYGVVHAVLEDGGSKGAAFPSSHVAVAVTLLPVAWRHDRLVFWLFLIPVIGLTLSTVYGRFHYGVDALGGLLLVAVTFPLGLKLRRWLGQRTPRKWPGAEEA